MENMIAINTTMLIILGSIAATAIIFGAVVLLDRRDATRFDEFVQSNGLEKVSESFPTDRFTLLEGGSTGTPVEWMRRPGTTDSSLVYVTRQRSTQTSGNDQRRRACALVALDIDSPRVRIARDGFFSETGSARGQADVERSRVDFEIGHAEFDRLFKIDAASIEDAHSVLSPELIGWIMQAERDGWKFDAEISGRWMLFNFGRRSAGLDQRLEWLDRAAEVRHVLPAAPEASS